MTDFNRAYTRWRQYLTEASSCPIKTQIYGGLPGGGGYGSGTEYEIGAQQIAEAAHCILGSIGKTFSGNDLRLERGHIMEELGIIKRAVKEYAKPLYTERIFRNPEEVRAMHYKEDYIDTVLGYSKKSVESIRTNSPKLERIARAKKQAIDKDYDPALQTLIEATYDVVIVLAQEMARGVKNWPQQEVDNAFQSSRLQAAVKNLDRAVAEVYR